jgi:hypothetical protein
MYSGYSRAVWRVKDVPKTEGWYALARGRWHYDGHDGHAIPNGIPSESLKECLKDATCGSI